MNGTSGDDTVDGGEGNDTISGLEGHDFLSGGPGSDVVRGGDGNDILLGYTEYEDSQLSNPAFKSLLDRENAQSNDILLGGAGDDLYLLDHFVNTPVIVEYASEGIDSALGDLLIYTLPDQVENYVNDGSHTVNGVEQSVVVTGNASDNLIKTTPASWETVDEILNTVSSTRSKNEVFRGLAGNDTLIAGLGDDTLEGGGGNDTIDGGEGQDTAVYTLAASNYAVTITATGYQVAAHSGDEGSDQLRDVESLQFADRTGTMTNFLVATGVPGMSINGTAGNDTLEGGVDNDTLLGLGGDDQINGGLGGHDLLDGGEGNDQLRGGAGNDTLIGGAGSNTLDGEGGNDSLVGGSEFDNINGGTGNDTLIGGGGNDGLYGGDDNGADLIDAGEGNDTLFGGPGSDSLRGGAGNDFFQVSEGGQSSGVIDVLDGGEGEDEFNLGSGGSSGTRIEITGGAARDTFRLMGPDLFGNLGFVITDFQAGKSGDLIDLLYPGAATPGPMLWSANSGGYTAGNPFEPTIGYLRLQASGQDTLLQWDPDGPTGTRGWTSLLTLQNVQANTVNTSNFVGRLVVGTAGNDLLDGDWANDTLSGNEGNDTIKAGDGADSIDGGTGNDDMAGGAGDDIYLVDSPGDIVREVADQGADKVITTFNHALSEGVEMLQVGADARAGTKGTGNALDNLMQANDSGNELEGGGGNDQIRGGRGKDSLYGGDGDDWVDAGDGDDLIVGGDGAGNDHYIGGSGQDTVRYTSAFNTILVNLLQGVASGQDIGLDTLNAIENLIGGKAGDTLVGDAQANVMDGHTGNDSITGGGGNDTLDGSEGQDTVVYALAASNYTVTVTATGYQVVAQSGGEGIDQLRNVESLQFADRTGTAASFLTAGGGQIGNQAKFWKNTSITPGQANTVAAVNLNDAISVLKMIVGLPVNSDNTPLSPHQSIAADFNQNGQVGLDDAIGMLKLVVGLDAPAPTWRYYDADQLKTSLSGNEALIPASWANSARIDDPTATGMRLIGVLTGDVDGSWVG
jgi:Ca2+-binding RTX toxin-like protein